VDEQILIDRRKRHHGPLGIPIAQCREDLSSDTEVWMSHVGLLGHIRKAERELTEVGRRHHDSIVNRESSVVNRNRPLEVVN
jgi:hypothetical protein